MIYKLMLPALLSVMLCCGAENAAPEAAPVPPPPAAAPLTTPPTEAELAYLMGKIDPASHPDFAAVGKPYTDKTGMFLRKETLAAFEKMYDAAKKDGVILRIISATRTFTQQKGIWEGKWTRFAREAPAPEARALKILEYSAMPGVSRHHWGTDIDLNDLNNPSFEPGGKYARVYEWLLAHAAEYGFCQPYTAKDDKRPNGYNEERWHWTYQTLSAELTNQYLQSVKPDMISGFQGAETAGPLEVIPHYAGGINQACR
jgi:zinc D-Ala-D-Ala carboxypeptidase